ncbi:hypothetical protein CC85DRAFT_69947 [Cutaneotrichosporon oleaginosum]|uniref:Uncharacterized protein n=1 Tax=Cutaneotrichosporon oleaginosum TaxID=879819 RepID=A0A0J0XPG7_9TREE|nr:uncharacterized protein CC85DRAFT_69947 [Cutaneotrichosporon oleaginosum]KLT43005.1 hypothetical protein CC85DRAFT_69947 [Cutaneotrichosporon oleaginosum]TXT11787.1 hypothetical protein COLE_02197 [Cutaneotrichosporon oleaginosum]
MDMFVHDLKEGGRAGCICSNHRLQVTGTIQLTPAYVGCESGTACKVVTPDPYCYSGQYGHRVTVQDNVKAEALSQGTSPPLGFTAEDGAWVKSVETRNAVSLQLVIPAAIPRPTSARLAGNGVPSYHTRGWTWLRLLRKGRKWVTGAVIHQTSCPAEAVVT